MKKLGAKILRSMNLEGEDVIKVYRILRQRMRKIQNYCSLNPAIITDSR